MEKGKLLTLTELGQAVFKTVDTYLARFGRDMGVEMSLVVGPLQESFTLFLPDGSSLFLKTFPHKNFKNETVFRIEVYMTRSGDMRGNRVAFIEIARVQESLIEIPPFVEGVLTRSSLSEPQ
ncbi:MAG: hypothetical protein HQM09_07055 [Candidatus Riflebacteria bacterium]|nr:hypothetical protein [Candidatus Riflebacteria bacterium]